MNTNKPLVILAVLGFSLFIYSLYELEKQNSRVKELETENKELREKSKPSLRMYNHPKCNCSCVR